MLTRTKRIVRCAWHSLAQNRSQASIWPSTSSSSQGRRFSERHLLQLQKAKKPLLFKKQWIKLVTLQQLLRETFHSRTTTSLTRRARVKHLMQRSQKRTIIIKMMGKRRQQDPIKERKRAKPKMEITGMMKMMRRSSQS